MSSQDKYQKLVDFHTAQAQKHFAQAKAYQEQAKNSNNEQTKKQLQDKANREIVEAKQHESKAEMYKKQIDTIENERKRMTMTKVTQEVQQISRKNDDDNARKLQQMKEMLERNRDR